MDALTKRQTWAATDRLRFYVNGDEVIDLPNHLLPQLMLDIAILLRSESRRAENAR